MKKDGVKQPVLWDGDWACPVSKDAIATRIVASFETNPQTQGSWGHYQPKQCIVIFGKSLKIAILRGSVYLVTGYM